MNPPRSALVTGGSSGIGAAVVGELRRAGTQVAVIDRDAAEGDGDLAVVCDVTDEAAVAAAVGEVRGRFGSLDLAVCNAGIGGFSPLLEMTADEWDRVFAVNARGVFVTMREAARVMVADGTGGAIVVTSSVSAVLGERGMAHYGSSKAAVNQLVRIAARELGPQGITVNAVAPGATDTALFSSTAAIPGYRRRVAERSALGEVGSAEAVAAAVVAVAGLRWVTGAVVPADGGVSLWSPIDPMERDR